jgi:hypothetical protein
VRVDAVAMAEISWWQRARSDQRWWQGVLLAGQHAPVAFVCLDCRCEARAIGPGGGPAQQPPRTGHSPSDAGGVRRGPIAPRFDMPFDPCVRLPTLREAGKIGRLLPLPSLRCVVTLDGLERARARHIEPGCAC